MNKIVVWVAILLVFAQFAARAQKVPENVLNLYEKEYSKNNSGIEKRFFPDFSRTHPNQMFVFDQCYPGKKICVYAIMAEKPKDWKFKINAGSSTLTPTQAVDEKQFFGKKYYTNFITVSFPGQMPDKGDKCMNIIAYDGENIDLPVYLYLFNLR